MLKKLTINLHISDIINSDIFLDVRDQTTTTIESMNPGT